MNRRCGDEPDEEKEEVYPACRYAVKSTFHFVVFLSLLFTRLFVLSVNSFRS